MGGLPSSLTGLVGARELILPGLTWFRVSDLLAVRGDKGCDVGRLFVETPLTFGGLEGL